jgi:branched-chain amino acid transport system permease protein
MRTSPSNAAGISWGHSLKDALAAGLITLILLGPITNIVLQQYSFQFLPERLPVILNGIYMAVIVSLVRFCVSVFAQTPQGRRFLHYFERKKSNDAGVVEPDSRNFLANIRKALSVYGVLAAACALLAWQGIIPAGAASALILSGLFVVFAYSISLPKSHSRRGGWVIVVPLLFLCGFLLPVVLNQAGLLPKVWISNLTLALIYVLLGLGLNIVVGMAGLLDLGFVGFYAVGAYLLALGHQYFDLGFWSALLLTPIVLRMHGDYLAIVTLGFGEIIRLVITNWIEVTGGPNGAPAPPPTFFGMTFARRAEGDLAPFHDVFGLSYSSDYKSLFIYLMLFIVVALMLRFFNRLRYMPLGRSWEALREDEIACRSLGINHVTIKLAAFVIGAISGGLAGVFFATYQGFINPTSFNFFESVLILSIVVLGGMGSMLGVIVAALALVLLPEFLREMADFRVLIFGLLMILMMIWRPYGLIRAKRPALTGAGNE